MKDNKEVYLGCDVSTQTIGFSLVIDDGSDYGKIIELTHISPKVPHKINGIEQLFLKKKIFEEFIIKYKDFGIDHVVIEEPLVRSNNAVTVSTLLRFNGMISDCIYNILGIVPTYISSYEAREYSFPELMSIRKYGKDENIYKSSKIIKSIKDGNFVLFGGYPWTIDKKSVLQEKVADIFPEIKWIYDKNGELKKENFDATDSYVACLGQMNKERFGKLDFKVNNIKVEKDKVDYDVMYWDKTIHRTTYLQ